MANPEIEESENKQWSISSDKLQETDIHSNISDSPRSALDVFLLVFAEMVGSWEQRALHSPSPILVTALNPNVIDFCGIYME